MMTMAMTIKILANKKGGWICLMVCWTVPASWLHCYNIALSPFVIIVTMIKIMIVTMFILSNQHVWGAVHFGRLLKHIVAILQIYTALLLHSITEVQKVALHCNCTAQCAAQCNLHTALLLPSSLNFSIVQCTLAHCKRFHFNIVHCTTEMYCKNK